MALQAHDYLLSDFSTKRGESVKLWVFWDALTRKRTDGALVGLTTPIVVRGHK
jgi:hypothetical protein